MEPIIVEFEVMATPEHAGDTYSGRHPGLGAVHRRRASRRGLPALPVTGLGADVS